jgi:hypothetical protein
MSFGTCTTAPFSVRLEIPGRSLLRRSGTFQRVDQRPALEGHGGRERCLAGAGAEVDVRARSCGPSTIASRK